jgi:hypothetical protein
MFSTNERSRTSHAHVTNFLIPFRISIANSSWRNIWAYRREITLHLSSPSTLPFSYLTADPIGFPLAETGSKTYEPLEFAAFLAKSNAKAFRLLEHLRVVFPSNDAGMLEDDMPFFPWLRDILPQIRRLQLKMGDRNADLSQVLLADVLNPAVLEEIDIFANTPFKEKFCEREWPNLRSIFDRGSNIIFTPRAPNLRVYRFDQISLGQFRDPGWLIPKYKAAYPSLDLVDAPIYAMRTFKGRELSVIIANGDFSPFGGPQAARFSGLPAWRCVLDYYSSPRPALDLKSSTSCHSSILEFLESLATVKLTTELIFETSQDLAVEAIKSLDQSFSDIPVAWALLRLCTELLFCPLPNVAVEPLLSDTFWRIYNLHNLDCRTVFFLSKNAKMITPSSWVRQILEDDDFKDQTFRNHLKERLSESGALE